MLGKKMFTSLLVIGLSSTFSFAHASALTIVNNTDFDSTSIINNGPCSTILGKIGVTRAHSTNVIPEDKLNLACIFNKENCTAKVYATNNCTGPVIATAVLSLKTGIKSVEVSGAGFTVIASGFNVTLNHSK